MAAFAPLGSEGLGDGMGDAAGGSVVFAAVAPVGQITGDGLVFGFIRRVKIAGVGFDAGKDLPSLPGFWGMAEPGITGDRLLDGLPGFIITSEFAQGHREIVHRRAFTHLIAEFLVDVRRLPEKARRLVPGGLNQRHTSSPVGLMCWLVRRHLPIAI